MTGWSKVDPDSAFDDLPEPYRTINKAIEDVIDSVAEEIDAIEGRKRSSDYEFDLLQASPTSSLLVAGRVTCAYTEARGSTRLAMGLSHGEVLIVDTRSREVITATRPFVDGEVVKCVSLVSDGAYHQAAPVPGQALQERLRPNAKLMVSGMVKPAVLVYDICREAFGTTLRPFCAINVPQPDEPPAPPDGEVTAYAGATPIEQLHTRGTHGAIWVVVLLFDRTIRTYLCPLGTPEHAQLDKKDSVATQAIPEEEEADAENPEDTEDFAKVIQINTPKYCLSLPSMVSLPDFPEPALDSFSLSVFALRSERRAGASQVPTYCFLSSTESNLLFCYSLRGPVPSTGAEQAAAALEEGETVGMEALLKQVAPQPGTLKEPSESMSLAPHRRWLLPARTSSMAVSPDGSTLAAGGSQGSLALINTAAGPALQAMLSGHYDAVLSLAFYRSHLLISIGADAWVHIFDVRLGSILARFPASRPPSPPPAVAVAASYTAPMALTLDVRGGMRLLDLGRCRKMASAHSQPQVEQQPEGCVWDSAPIDGYPGADAPPVQVFSTANGFSVLCYEEGQASPVQSSPSPTAPPEKPGSAEERPDSAGDASAAEASGGAPAASPEPAGNSYLVFFDYVTTLSNLFPGIAGRMAHGEPALALFENLTAEELAEKPPERRLDQSSGLPPQSTMQPHQVTRTGSKTMGDTRKSLAQSRSGSKTLPSNTTRKSLAGGTASSLARLTTENLQKLDKPSSAKSMKRMMTTQSEAGAAEKAGSRVLGPRAGPQAIPENWQVTVKRHLRNTMADKTVRQGKILNYMEAVRKELEG